MEEWAAADGKSGADEFVVGDGGISASGVWRGGETCDRAAVAEEAVAASAANARRRGGRTAVNGEQ